MNGRERRRLAELEERVTHLEGIMDTFERLNTPEVREIVDKSIASLMNPEGADNG